MIAVTNMNLDTTRALMGMANTQDGDVYAPGGYFCLIEVTESVVRELSASHVEVPEEGWYLTVQDGHGQVRVWRAEDEDSVLDAFSKQADRYHDWLDTKVF